MDKNASGKKGGSNNFFFKMSEPGANVSGMEVDNSYVNGRPQANGDTNDENRQRLENQLEGLIETLRQSVISVEDFKTGNQPGLNAKLYIFMNLFFMSKEQNYGTTRIARQYEKSI